MARTPITIVLSEREKQKLTRSAQHAPDPEFARRCRIILACGNGNPTNAEAAANVGTDTQNVNYWRKRWAEKKMEGLKFTHGGGSISIEEVHQMEERIRILLEDESMAPEGGWTVRKLSRILEMPEDRVRTAMKRKGLALDLRYLPMTVENSDPLETDLVGLYLSRDQQAAVFCLSPISFTTDRSMAETRRYDIYQDFAKAKAQGPVSLPGFIHMAAERADDCGEQDPIARDIFLKKVIETEPDNPNLIFELISNGGEKPRYRGSRIDQVYVYEEDRRADWVRAVETRMNDLGDPERDMAGGAGQKEGAHMQSRMGGGAGPLP